jgi:hypothetical protein
MARREGGGVAPACVSLANSSRPFEMPLLGVCISESQLACLFVSNRPGPAMGLGLGLGLLPLLALAVSLRCATSAPGYWPATCAGLNRASGTGRGYESFYSRPDVGRVVPAGCRRPLRGTLGEWRAPDTPSSKMNLTTTTTTTAAANQLVSRRLAGCGSVFISQPPPTRPHLDELRTGTR